MVPLPKGDVYYQNKRSARGKLVQQGRYPFNNVMKRPRIAQLNLYEGMWRKNVALKRAVTARVNWLLSTIGEVTHSNPAIQDYHRANLKLLEDAHGKCWRKCLEDAIVTMYWAGSSVSEVLYQLKSNAIYLKDILTYHPQNITFFPTKEGLLEEGELSYDGYHQSGVWQLTGAKDGRERQLSMWKHIILCSSADFGNYYGYSAFDPSYQWYRISEAISEMQVEALAKIGSKCTFISMPSYTTNEPYIDPNTGEEKMYTGIEFVKAQWDSQDGLPELLLAPQQDPNNKATVTSLSLTDQVTEVYRNAIDWADGNAVGHIIPPYLIGVGEARLVEPVVRERQLDAFCNEIDAERELIIGELIKKVFLPAQQLNFTGPEALEPPTFPRLFSDRTEDRVSTMQIIKGLVDCAVFNPFNEDHRATMFQMLKLPYIRLTEDDVDFIYEMLVMPREKPPRNSDVNSQGSGNVGRPVGNVHKQIDAKAPKQS